jgi:voltage-gated potassium channel
VASLALIALSVLLVMLETVEEIEARYDTLFFVLEWIITILFTIEYIARLVTVTRSPSIPNVPEPRTA